MILFLVQLVALFAVLFGLFKLVSFMFDCLCGIMKNGYQSGHQKLVGQAASKSNTSESPALTLRSYLIDKPMGFFVVGMLVAGVVGMLMPATGILWATVRFFCIPFTVGFAFMAMAKAAASSFK